MEVVLVLTGQMFLLHLKQADSIPLILDYFLTLNRTNE